MPLRPEELQARPCKNPAALFLPVFLIIKRKPKYGVLIRRYMSRDIQEVTTAFSLCRREQFDRVVCIDMLGCERWCEIPCERFAVVF